MSYQERIAVGSLISGLIVFAIYANYICDMHQNGRFEGPDASALVGMSALILIGVSIIANIIINVAQTLLYALVTKHCERPITDERDKLIELKSMQIGFITFSIGFVASMALLAFNVLPAHQVFLLIIASMFGASIIGIITKLFLYRRGF